VRACFVLLCLLLGACAPVAPDASNDAPAPVTDAADSAPALDVAQSADVPVACQRCPGGWLCGERRAGEYACEPAPSNGACPGGWHACDGRCWLVNGTIHCGTCGVRCAEGQRCFADPWRCE